MGRKAKINITEQASEENLQDQQNTEILNEDHQAPQENAEKSNVDTSAPKTQEIPDYVEKILKMYSDYEELYISNKGGVFTVGTPEHIRGNAVLYKNKYFHK